jgi:hypothetical protein
MKKSAFLLLLLPLLAGCKESTDTPNPVESSKISLLGSVSSTVNTRGDGVIDPSVSGFETKVLGLNFARINQDAATGVYPSYGSTALNATRAAGTGSKAIAFDAGSEQYYTPAGTNSSSKMVGWYPRVSENGSVSFASGVVSFTIDGSTDVMLSNEVAGSTAALFSADEKKFTFNHLLTQLQFKVYAVDDAAKTSWGTITSVKVKSQYTACSVTLPAAISFPTTGTTSDLSVLSGATLEMGVGSANAVSVGYSMIAPVAAAGSVTLEIVTSAGETGTVVIPVPATGFLASNAYVITLSFSNRGITGSAGIGAWESHTVADEVGVS